MTEEAKDPLEGYKPAYVVKDEKTEDGRLIARGKLKHGIKIKDVLCKDFEMVEGLASEQFEAETLAPAANVVTFQAALLCVQLRSLGTYKGPFTLSLLGRLKPGDFKRLQAAQMELDVLGEAG